MRDLLIPAEVAAAAVRIEAIVPRRLTEQASCEERYLLIAKYAFGNMYRRSSRALFAKYTFGNMYRRSSRALIR